MTTTLIFYLWIHLSIIKGGLENGVVVFTTGTIIWALIADIFILVWLIKKSVKG